jgi:hypothetical protein
LGICKGVHAATRLAGIEAEFSEAWSQEARTVLPCGSPELHPNAIWGPMLAYVVIDGMAAAIGAKDSATTALALFDRLRLREPMARAFSGGGEISEDGWRAAARVRLAFLYQTLIPAKPAKAGAEEVFAGLPRGLWDDGDARWLLKVHESGGEWYFNKELHQQILWWTQLPELLRLAAPAEKSPAAGGKKARQPDSRATSSVEAIEQRVEEACEQAEEAGFRVGKRKEIAVKPAKREKGALAK